MLCVMWITPFCRSISNHFNAVSSPDRMPVYMAVITMAYILELYALAAAMTLAASSMVNTSIARAGAPPLISTWSSGSRRINYSAKALCRAIPKNTLICVCVLCA